LKPGACAVLYQEVNCQECRFPGIILDYPGVFETKNSAVIKSIVVQPGCEVTEATFGAMDFVDTPYDFYHYESGRVSSVHEKNT